MSTLNPSIDPGLVSRVEDAGLNASAPTQQRWVDGWLLRLSPGKAKRARCINAVAAGRLPVAEKLARAEAAYRDADLPLFVRITPFTVPAGLDTMLAERGYSRVDDTRVMVCAGLSEPGPLQLPPRCKWETPDGDTFARKIGELRGSPISQRQAHAERLASSPVPYQAMSLVRDSHLMACGQFAIEDDLVGLYDVFTAPAARGHGLATLLCRQLLAEARQRGARHAYLQVDADNASARAVYHRLGFIDAYAYHYRQAPEGSPAV